MCVSGIEDRIAEHHQILLELRHHNHIPRTESSSNKRMTILTLQAILKSNRSPISKTTRAINVKYSVRHSLRHLITNNLICYYLGIVNLSRTDILSGRKT